jgi:thymidylate synthase
VKAYLDILKEVVLEGSVTPQRAKVKGEEVTMRVLPGMVFRHDLAKGFPLLTTKFVSLEKVAAELEMFIKGVTRKEFLHERGCHIWDSWQAPNQDDPNELGPVYGKQWRRWEAFEKVYDTEGGVKEPRAGYYDVTYIDQLANLLATLITNPYDRRTVVSAWNPADNDKVALPACHTLWQTVVTKDDHGRHVLNLCLTMRSADLVLGVPFNIASYALLLLLLAKHVQMIPGRLTTIMNNCHVYENHVPGALEQLQRTPLLLPEVKVPDPTDGRPFSLGDWSYKDLVIERYKHHPALKFEVAV